MVEKTPQEKPAPEKSAEEKPEGKSKPRTFEKKSGDKPLLASLGCFPWIALAIVLAATGYWLYKQNYQDEPPPPKKKTFTVAAFDFYRAYQESVESLAKGKILFFQGRALLGGNPETLPESATLESRPSLPFFKAAEHFAAAMEQIQHADDLVKTDTVGLKPYEKECRNLLSENLGKYRDAVKIFNEYAKAQYQGSEAKAEKFALSDGNAKWDMAETLMAKQLTEGCKGEFFSHVQEQKPEFRRKAFESYRAFYGDSFEAQRLVFSTLMAYPGPAESLPSATPASAPTKVFIRSPE